MVKLALSVVGVLALAASLHALDCGDGKVRGVNIGGLFMMEPWITPGIFEDANARLGVVDQVVDEYTFHQYLDPADAATILDRHWDTFYSQADLQELFDSGISHIRVPIAYWLVNVLDEEPFPPPPATDNDGQRFYLKRFMGWADQVGLKVLIDLHGAPESQNGFDNSGRRGPIDWFASPYNDYSNVDRTYEILGQVSDLIVGWVQDGTIRPESLYGIAILNEPWGPDEEIWALLRDEFNINSYGIVFPRLATLQPANPDPRFVIQQAFRAHSDYVGYMSDYAGTSVDFHEYHAFSDYYNDIALDFETAYAANIQGACDFIGNLEIQTLGNFVGEWSLAITDCQEYLNGGYYTPYVAPIASAETCAVYNSDFSTFTDEYKDFLREFMLAQMDSYENGGNGFFFWTGKTEDNCAPEWDYLFLLQNGIAPSNLCERETICV